MLEKQVNFDNLRNQKIWIPKVIITKIPLVVSALGKDVCPNDIKIPEINSWAKRFNISDEVYGVEITPDSMHFFSPILCFYNQASEKGDIILQGLIQRFPGIDGYSQPCIQPTFPSESIEIYCPSPLEEPISNPVGKINLVKKFLLSTIKEGVDLRLIILFEEINNTNTHDINNVKFKLKINFIDVLPQFNSHEEKSLHQRKIKSIIYSLFSDSLDFNLKGLFLNRIPEESFKDIWSEIWTYYKFSRKNEATIELKSNEFDFSFPVQIRNLDQSFYFPNENQMLLNKHHVEDDYLILGSLLSYGAVTKRIGICPIDLLRRNMGIFGITGTGKTYLNLWIISELIKKRPKTGILVLNLAKQNQDVLYRNSMDVFCIYGENNFSIPYLVFKEEIDLESENIPASSTMPLQATAQLLMSCLDLKDPYINVASSILEKSYENHCIPEKLDEIFDKISDSIKKYGKDLNQNMRGIFENRRGILRDELFLETTKFLNGKVPDWFDWWLQGKNVFLDLSTCANNYVKSMLVFLILHMINIRSKELPVGIDEIRNIIFMDEAHCAFPKPKNNSESAVDEIKNQLLGQFLSENRSKGFSIIISDQQPTFLLDVTHQSIAIRINFNINESASNFFYSNTNERNLIRQLAERIAHVKFGNKSFFIKTIDINKNKILARNSKIPRNPSENWYISKILKNPFYLSRDIPTTKITSSFNSYFHTLISKRKFLQASFIVFGLWNNLHKYFLRKMQDEGIKIDNSHYIGTLLYFINETNPLFSRIFNDFKYNKVDFRPHIYNLNKNDVLLFYKSLMNFTKEIQDDYIDKNKINTKIVDQKGVNQLV